MKSIWKPRVISWGLVLTVFWLVGSAVGEQVPESSDLEGYLQEAMLNNAGLKASFERWKAALENVPAARTLPDPKFTYTYLARHIETRVGPQRHRFALMQMFPWFGKLALKGSIAGAKAEAARHAYEAQKLKVFHQVKNVYYEYYYLGKAINLTRDNIELLEGIEAVARAKFKAGRTMQRHVIKIQVELGKLENRLASLEDKRRPLVAQLNATMNRALDTEIPIPRDVVESPFTMSDAEAVRLLGERNPRLRAMTSMIEAAERSLELAHKRYKPDLSVGVTFMETGEAQMVTPESGKDPIALMATLNVPIWRSSLRAGVEGARRSAGASRHELAQLSNTLEAQLARVLFGLRDAGRQIALFRDTLIPKAWESLKNAQAAYIGGATDLIDLLDAERTLLDLQLNYYRAITTKEQRLAEAEMLVGTTLW